MQHKVLFTCCLLERTVVFQWHFASGCVFLVMCVKALHPLNLYALFSCYLKWSNNFRIISVHLSMSHNCCSLQYASITFSFIFIIRLCSPLTLFRTSQQSFNLIIWLATNWGRCAVNIYFIWQSNEHRHVACCFN